MRMIMIVCELKGDKNNMGYMHLESGMCTIVVLRSLMKRGILLHENGYDEELLACLITRWTTTRAARASRAAACRL